MRIHRLKIGAATVFAMALTSLAIIGPAGISWAANTQNDTLAQANDLADQTDRDAKTVHLKLMIPSP